MKKLLGIIIAIVIVVLIIVGISQKQAPRDISDTASSTPMKVGIIMPLTGPAAALGEATKNSVELALSKLASSTRSHIEVIYADDAFDPKQTVAVAQKLIDVDKVNAIIAYSSPSSVAASYIAEKAGVPMIGIGNAPDINTGKQWVVRYMLGPDLQARAIVDLLIKGKYKKVALLWNQSDGPKSVHDALAKILPSEGYTVVADESVTKAETDFKTAIAKIRAAKPDVVVPYISPQIGVFGKQAKDLGLNVPMVSGPVFEIVDQLKAAEGGLDNQLFASNDNVTFINDYFAKYASYPTIAGDYTYDAVTVLATIAEGPSTSPTDIEQALRKTFTGVAGNYAYNPDGSFEVIQVIKKWDGTKFVVVGGMASSTGTTN